MVLPMEKFKSEGDRYYIDGKEVQDAKVYISMLEHELETLKEKLNTPLPKLNIPPSEYIEHNEESGEFCPECQAILDFIYDLAEMEPEDAIVMFSQTITQAAETSFLEGIIHASTELGNISHKIAARNSIDLEDLQKNMYNGEN
jgi:hypothetical protein